MASYEVGERVFSNRRDGFGLAWVRATTLPVSTVDGGQVWRVDGPLLYQAAADAPAAVGDIGLVRPRMFYAYGLSVVDVTPDGGRVWWQMPFVGCVVAVVPRHGGRLVAHVREGQDCAKPGVTYRYLTRDGGRHWRSDGAVPRS